MDGYLETVGCQRINIEIMYNIIIAYAICTPVFFALIYMKGRVDGMEHARRIINYIHKEFSDE